MTKQPLAIIMTGETRASLVHLMVPNTNPGFLGLSLRQNINIFFKHFLFIITILLHHEQVTLTRN